MRVLDLTDALGAAGARALVGIGADVLRVDPGDDDHAARIHWHAGKRWVRAADLDDLARQADVVLESGPLVALRGVTPEGASRWPDAVHVVVTPFGLTGPRRHWRGDDLVLASAGGMTWLGGRPDGPPTPPPFEAALGLAGVHGAIAALLGVLAGGGQLIDVSAQEAVAATLETGAITWIHAGRVPGRTGGVYEHVAHRVFPASDGSVAGGWSGSERMWTDLLAWLVEVGEAEDLTDPRFADPVTRWQERPHVDAVVARFAARRPAAAIAAEGRRRSLPWAEVAAPSRLTANPQLRERGFFRDVGGVEDVGVAWTPDPAPSVAPIEETTRPWRSARRAARPRRGRPLDDVRVLDLTWVLAGPYATRQLAEHGADVIKIESWHRQDPTRFSPGMRLRPGAGPDDSGYFLNVNRGKRSVALNLRTDRGAELLRRLVPHCDVVIENFSPGTLARWGLDPDGLQALRPGVVLVSMAGLGATGPWRDAVTFADTLAAMAGHTHATAEPGGPPQGLTFGLGDMIAANAAVLATLTMLAEGRGGHVDLSQLEAMAAAVGPSVVRSALGEEAPAGCGDVLPAAGDDRWVAVSATDDDQRRALHALIGDRDLAAWTAARDAAEAAAALQGAGVPAAVVATGRDLVDFDEHLAARGFYPILEHPIAGPVRHEGVVARLARTPAEPATSAPLLGQHTAEVLGELLGLGADELAALEAEGVTE
ncbi:CaiB/BaiF CoA-transferase family protein [Actinomycetospora sp. C-140]